MTGDLHQGTLLMRMGSLMKIDSPRAMSPKRKRERKTKSERKRAVIWRKGRFSHKVS